MGYRILLTEAESDLAKTFIKCFEDYSYSLLVCQDGDANWQDGEQVTDWVKRKQPSLVINTMAVAGLLDDDYGCCVELLARACQERAIPIIHLSSYRVFSAPCDDTIDEMDFFPSNGVAAEFLLREENAVLAASNAIVLRLSWLIDYHGENLLTYMCRCLVEKQRLDVADNCAGSPVHYDDIFRVVVAIVQQVLCGAENWGVFHLKTSEPCLEAEFAEYISRTLVAEGVNVGDFNVGNQDQCLMGGNADLAGVRCNNNFGLQLRNWRQGVKGLIMAWLDEQGIEHTSRK